MSETGDDHGTSEIESKVERLQTEIESIKKNASPLTKFGAYVGIVVGCFTLGKMGFDFYQWLTKSPQLDSVAGHELTLEYRPQKKQVTFQFNVSLANYGQTANVIDSAGGQLAMRNNTGGSPLYFSAVDFECSLDGAKVSMPLSLQPGLPATVACSVSESVPEQAQMSLLSPNEQRLTVAFHGLKKTVTQLEYCFTLSNGVIAEASRQSSQTVQRRFIDAKCD